MKGLHKIIFPFAPDQSGAVSVLASLSGIIVVIDAGGCTGNICGFDLPGWVQSTASGEEPKIFSAGLRDMDAIFGRDRELIDKLAEITKTENAPFAALVGTPVPATIGTDYKALARMAKKKCGLPVLAIDTNGAAWYDRGAEKAYLALIDAFCGPEKKEDVIPGSVGVWGLTPLDFGNRRAKEVLRKELEKSGKKKVCIIGEKGSLSDLEGASSFEENLVVSVSGLAAAKKLLALYGTPYRVLDLPFMTKGMERDRELAGKKVLIVHEQVMANARRKRILKETGNSAKVTCAAWFLQDNELMEPGDFHIADEDAFLSLVQEGSYDAVLADESLLFALRDFAGEKISYPHYAVSGKEEVS